MFLAPGGLTARFFGRGTGLVFAIFARVTGVDMFAELSGFFRSLTGVIDGFGERTRGVAELLREPREHGFLIVTSPEPEPAREAMFVADGSATLGMARDGLIVNRVHLTDCDGHSTEQVQALLAAELGDSPRAARSCTTSRTSTCSSSATTTRSTVSAAGSPSPIR